MRNLVALALLVPILGLVLVTCDGPFQDNAASERPPPERLELEAKQLELQGKRLDLETKMFDLAVKRFEFEAKRLESMAQRRPAGGATVGRRGRPIDAIDEFNEIIRLNPEDALAYAQRSRVYRRLGMPQRALRDLDEAIRINPQFGAAYLWRARLRTLLGMDAEAGQDVRRAEELGFDTARLKEAMEKLKRIR